MELDERDLYKQFFEIIKLWNLKQTDICQILGVQRCSLSRMNKSKKFNLAIKQKEIAVEICWIYTLLESHLGSDFHIRKWMTNFHTYDDFRGVPMEMIKTISGLIKINSFLRRYHANYVYFDDLMALECEEYDGGGINELLAE